MNSGPEIPVSTPAPRIGGTVGLLISQTGVSADNSAGVGHVVMIANRILRSGNLDRSLKASNMQVTTCSHMSPRLAWTPIATHPPSSVGSGLNSFRVCAHRTRSTLPCHALTPTYMHAESGSSMVCASHRKDSAAGASCSPVTDMSSV